MATTSFDQAHPFGTVLTAMVTPFKDDGSIDVDGAVRLAEHLVAHGHDGIVIHGTTGESPTTYHNEKRETLRAVKEAVGDKAKIVAGVGTNDTNHTVELARRAAEDGADGLLVVTPYYSRPSQAGLIQHFLTVADATSVPVLVYDIPGRTGVAIDEKTLIEIAQHPRIVGVKDATGKPAQGFRRQRLTNLAWYSGDDGLNLAFLAQGAAGVISVAGHVTGDAWRTVSNAMDSGDLATARSVFAKMEPVVHAIMGGGQGAVMAKAALQLTGVLHNRIVRPPLAPATDAELATVRAALEEAGLL